MDIRIEGLNRDHDREPFDCGVFELNAFLKRYAFQNQKNYISKTFVAIDAEQSPTKKEILGFYTLASGELEISQLPKNIKHPKYPVSIARLARLAVDLKHQGKGIAGFLLYDVLQKMKLASQMMGVFALVVDSKNETAKSFYQHYNFIELEGSTLSLFLPMSVIDKL